MKAKIFIAIIMILSIILCIVSYTTTMKIIENTRKANCINYNLQGVIDMTDLKQLCTNDWCNYYFDKRIEYFENSVNRCGAGEIYAQESDPKEDVYINIDDLNKSDPTIYVRNGSGFVEDGN